MAGALHRHRRPRRIRHGATVRLAGSLKIAGAAEGDPTHFFAATFRDFGNEITIKRRRCFAACCFAAKTSLRDVLLRSMAPSGQNAASQRVASQQRRCFAAWVAKPTHLDPPLQGSTQTPLRGGNEAASCGSDAGIHAGVPTPKRRPSLRDGRHPAACDRRRPRRAPASCRRNCVRLAKPRRKRIAGVSQSLAAGRESNRATRRAVGANNSQPCDSGMQHTHPSSCSSEGVDISTPARHNAQKDDDEAAERRAETPCSSVGLSKPRGRSRISSPQIVSRCRRMGGTFIVRRGRSLA